MKQPDEARLQRLVHPAILIPGALPQAHVRPRPLAPNGHAFKRGDCLGKLFARACRRAKLFPV
jgi:hypothetical protein